MSCAKAAYKEYYTGVDDRDFHLPRYRWTIDTFVPGATGQRVLEIGCGDGGCIQLLRHGNDVVGIDASESGVEECRARSIPVILGDVSTESLPFESHVFDIVISLETFEHLTNPQHAIDEVTRVLKQDGVFICSIPNPRIGHPYLYPGLFEFGNFQRFLAQNGFAVRRVVPWGWAPRETILPTCLRRNRVARSRYVAGVIRRGLYHLLRRSRFFPHYLYWLWTFESIASKREAAGMIESQARTTKPGRPFGEAGQTPSPARRSGPGDCR